MEIYRLKKDDYDELIELLNSVFGREKTLKKISKQNCLKCVFGMMNICRNILGFVKMGKPTSFQ